MAFLIDGTYQDNLLACIVYSIGAVIFLCSLPVLSPTLLLECCGCCCGCCRNKVLPPRTALRRLWMSWRVVIFVLGATLGQFPLQEFWTDPYLFTNPVKVGVIMLVVQFWGAALLTTPRNRGRIHRMLIELGGKSPRPSACLSGCLLRLHARVLVLW